MVRHPISVIHVALRRLIVQAKGLGIALVAAQKARIPVTLVDSSQQSLDKGLKLAGNGFHPPQEP